MGKGLTIGMFVIMALAAVPAPAAATSTADWNVSCDGNGSSWATWDWLTDGAVISSGSVGCSGSGSATGNAGRPDGANGITVTVTAYGILKDGTKTVTKSFAVDASFKLKATASVSDHLRSCIRGWYCEDLQVHESVSLSVVG